jgi:hypothetical protein
MSPKRMGRPPKPPTPGEMAPLSVRITAGLKARVQAAAEANGRSFSAEVEQRLEDSFHKDQSLAATKELNTVRRTLDGVGRELAHLQADLKDLRDDLGLGPRSKT